MKSLKPYFVKYFDYNKAIQEIFPGVNVNGRKVFSTDEYAVACRFNDLNIVGTIYFSIDENSDASSGTVQSELFYKDVNWLKNFMGHGEVTVDNSNLYLNLRFTNLPADKSGFLLEKSLDNLLIGEYCGKSCDFYSEALETEDLKKLLNDKNELDVFFNIYKFPDIK